MVLFNLSTFSFSSEKRKADSEEKPENTKKKQKLEDKTSTKLRRLRRRDLEDQLKEKKLLKKNSY